MDRNKIGKKYKKKCNYFILFYNKFINFKKFLENNNKYV